MFNKLVGVKGFDYVFEVEFTRIPYPNIMGQREESRAMTRECWRRSTEETKRAVGI